MTVVFALLGNKSFPWRQKTTQRRCQPHPFDDSRLEYLYHPRPWDYHFSSFLLELAVFDYDRNEPKNLPIRLKRAFSSFKANS